jgi:hypothetical protein
MNRVDWRHSLKASSNIATQSIELRAVQDRAQGGEMATKVEDSTVPGAEEAIAIGLVKLAIEQGGVLASRSSRRFSRARSSW